MSDSRLDGEFERRGLLRPGDVSRVLHMDHETFAAHVRLGHIKMTKFPWPAAGRLDGPYKTGLPLAELVALHERMWPDHDSGCVAEHAIRGARTVTREPA